MSRSIQGEVTSENLKDRNWDGEGITFDPKLAQKPTEKERRCTDVLCAIIFFCFLIAMGGVTIYGYVEGHPWEYIAPIDGENHICGFSDGYKDYDYLYIADIMQASEDPDNAFRWGVCVKSCPSDPTDTIDCIPTQWADCTLDEANQYGSKRVLDYCIPKEDTLSDDVAQNYADAKAEYQSSDLGSAMTDLYESRWMLLLTPVICIIFTFIYIYFMDKCAFWLSWISIILVELTLVGIGLAAYFKRQDIIEGDTKEEIKDNSQAYALNWCCWLSWSFALLYVLLILCTCRALRVAIAVIETAADFFADTKRLIGVPILFFCVGILCFFGWVMAILGVGSIGEITNINYQDQSKHVDWSSETGWLVAFMVFAIVWLMIFIQSCNEFIIIVSAVTWYFSDKTVEDDDGIPGDSDVSFGFYWCFRYHWGSLAFGSLILTIVWFIRALFEYIGKKVADASGENGCTKCIICCLRCCLDCFDRFVRFLNRNAYIYMALSNESFCTSALHAFILMLKNAAKFSFVDGIAEVFMFLAKALISLLTTVVMYFMIGWTTEVQSPILPLIVIWIFSYILSAVFIAIFDIGANTLLQCYILDQEIAKSDGKLEPDHIPPTMTKFFNNDEVKDMMTKNEMNYQKLPSDDKANNMT